jgi:polysaccharide export outer membrane protein
LVEAARPPAPITALVPTGAARHDGGPDRQGGDSPMPARTPKARRSRRRTRGLALALAIGPCLAPAGCGALDDHRERKIPHYGAYDPGQPRELKMVSMPPYVVEPPDELEVSVRPATLDLPLATVTVRQDGVIDLGFSGEVYVAGLTIPEAELKIAQSLAPLAARRNVREPIQVSVRLVNGSATKQYYVLGTVTTQGSFPLTGSETVLDGILRAGLRSNSLPEKAYLARPHPAGGPDQVLRIDWERIKMGDTFTNYQLMPGDRIVVPGGRPPGLLSTLFGG